MTKQYRVVVLGLLYDLSHPTDGKISDPVSLCYKAMKQYKTNKYIASKIVFVIYIKFSQVKIISFMWDFFL